MTQSEKSRERGSAFKQTMDTETVSSLIVQLGNRDNSVRRQAFKGLLETGEDAVPQLVEALASRNDHERWESGKLLDEINVDWKKHADDKTIKALLSDLGSKDGLVRVRARLALVTIGRKAVSALEEALASGEEWKRWEAAKALCEIGDPAAIEALLKALEDEFFDVRWLAAEGLIAIGQAALKPLLKRIIKNPGSIWLREGSHHVLHGIDNDEFRGIINPVLAALEDVEAPIQVPFAANAALKQISEIPSRRPRGRKK